MRETVREVCSKCDTCQRLKRNKKNYGKLPPKQAEATPWQTMCVDLICKYKLNPNGGGKKYEMITEKNKVIYLQAFTMIGQATGWIEIIAVSNARADLDA